MVKTELERELCAALADLLRQVSDDHMSEAAIIEYHNAIFAKSVSQARRVLAKCKH